MDKRINKTLDKIYIAFKNILSKQPYSSITIQEILKEANVARSTFYSHYKTKEDLLRSLCSSIFNHVFSHSLKSEDSHDFSASSVFEYTHYITHIFYHIKDEKELIHSILSSEAKPFFMNEIEKELSSFANECLIHQLFKNKDLPRQVKYRSIINNFEILLQYWATSNYKESPEKLTDYFMILNN